MSGNGEDQAALPRRETAERTFSADGAEPSPESSQASSAPVTRAKAIRVEASGVPSLDSMVGTVARDSPARRPSSAPESPESFRRCATREAIDFTATHIAMATNVVKSLPVAAAIGDGQDPRVRTLADRITWIQHHSGPKKLSIAEVARRGGMTRQGLSRLVRESRKQPGKSIGEAATMEALAVGNSVDLNWLMTGAGAPRRGKLSPLDTVLGERDWSDVARAAAMTEKRELSIEQWRQLLTGIEDALGSVQGSTAKKTRARKSVK